MNNQMSNIGEPLVFQQILFSIIYGFHDKIYLTEPGDTNTLNDNVLILI
jgi:hypothetical protein